MALTTYHMARNMSTLLFENIGDYSTFHYPEIVSKISPAFENNTAEFITYLLTAETVVVLLGLLVFIVYKFVGKYANNGENTFYNSEHTPHIEAITSSTVPQAKILLPFRLPFIDGFYTLHCLQKDGIRILEKWRATYGNLFEMPLGISSTYAISDPSIIQKVLTSTNPLHLNKPRFIYDKIFLDCMHDGLINSEYQIWSHHRKLSSRAFSYKAQPTYLKFMNQHARNLANNLILECSIKKDGAKGVIGSVEGEQVWNLLYFHAVKIIINLVMGSGHLSDDEMAKFNQDFIGYKRTIMERLLKPELHFFPYWYFHPNKKEYDHFSHQCDLFFNRAIQLHRNEYVQRKKEKTQQQKKTSIFAENIDGNDNVKDIFSVEKKSDVDDKNVGDKPFRCLIEEMIYCKATDKEIYDEVGTFITAGHETTVNALQFLLLHLALNPEYQTNCRNEVNSLFESKGVHPNAETESADLTMDDLSSLKYLERCILESLRITPTIPMFLRNLEAPLKIDDNLVLRKGTCVAILSWLLHRDPKHYPNPEKFDPDRFLPENVKNRHSYAFTPFSGGIRNCIGWKVAIMEIKVILAWILYNFDIYTTDKLYDVKLMFEVTLQPERNYNIILKKREK